MVAKPANINAAVAASERGERRAIPQTPCPLVEPGAETHEQAGCDERRDRSRDDHLWPADQRADDPRAERQSKHEGERLCLARTGVGYTDGARDEAANARDPAGQNQQHRGG